MIGLVHLCGKIVGAIPTLADLQSINVLTQVQFQL